MGMPPTSPFKVARNGDRYAAHRDVGIGTLSFKVTTAEATEHFWWPRLRTMPKAVPLDICIAIRTSGSTSLKVNTLSKLATSDTGLGRATRPSGRVDYHTVGST
jgi:hypothetical protein